MFKKLVGSVLGARGQVVLLLIILAAAGAVRFILPASAGIDLNRLGFTSSSALDTGVIVYSDADQDLYLILNQDCLYRRRGEEIRMVAEDVINILAHQDRLWIKTQTQVAELILSNGAVIPQLFANSLECRNMPFADARLVGIRDQRCYLSTEQGVLGIAPGSSVEGPYYLEGRRREGFVEQDWSQGVVFIQDNSWIVYLDFMEQERVELDYALGELREAVISPDASSLIYAVQQENLTAVWHAQVTGAEAELLFQQEMKFSNLEVLWSPDLSLAAVSILGYEGDAAYSDNFHSVTFLYHPDQGTAMLNKSYGQEIKALVPTAWDAGQSLIWFNWLHEESPLPIGYSLFSR